jgi:hypothetical protein
MWRRRNITVSADSSESARFPAIQAISCMQHIDFSQ